LSGAPLDGAAERVLWEKIKNGDEDSREKIILAYRPMVFWLAKKFRAPYNSYQDLIQEGMLGLITAADNFEPERSAKFITYAYYKVRGRMANFLSRSEAKAPLPVEDDCLERRDSFEADVDRMEWRISLGEGLDKLPQKEKDVVRSLIVEGKRVCDVAEEFGVGASHIYRIQRSAVARLKALFQNRDATSGA
jgi:RNA polymerase sporulation-specific sigma factor